MKAIQAVVLLSVLLLLTSCSGPPSQKAKESLVKDNKTFLDARGKAFSFQMKPKKIVSLMPSNTEILFSLGLGKKVVGVSAYDDYPAQAKKITKVASTEVNVEKIIALKPNLVLAHETSLAYQKDAYKQLEDANIPVFVVSDAQSLAAVFKSIMQIGQLTGADKAAQAVVVKMTKQKEALVRKVNHLSHRPTVWLEISNDLYTAGRRTFMNEMLQLAGGKNIVKQAGYVRYSEEKVIQSDPDMIIAAYPNGQRMIKKRSSFQSMKALRLKQVYRIDMDKISRPGPRMIEGATAVYQLIQQNAK